MFLVNDGGRLIVFDNDPRDEGFTGDVENVKWDDSDSSGSEWQDGHDKSKRLIGRNVHDPKHYRVFDNADELLNAGFIQLDYCDQPCRETSWLKYTQGKTPT